MPTLRGPIGMAFGTGTRSVPKAPGGAVGPGVWSSTPPGGAAADHGSPGSSGSVPIMPSGAPAGTYAGSCAAVIARATGAPATIALARRITAAARVASATAPASTRLSATSSRSRHDDVADPFDPREAATVGHDKTQRIPVRRGDRFAFDVRRQERSLGLRAVECPAMARDRDRLDRRRGGRDSASGEPDAVDERRRGHGNEEERGATDRGPTTGERDKGRTALAPHERVRHDE